MQRLSLGSSLAIVGFQFTYTTVFGWLATWLFLSTGHALAPALAHAACNALGVPPLGAMARRRLAGQPALLWATAGGVALFAGCGGRLLQPARFGNELYNV